MRSRVIVMPQDEYQRWLETSERRVRVAAATGAGAQAAPATPADQTTTP
jgi:heme/copper-type cytochrome/quinol oxidase subunit 2